MARRGVASATAPHVLLGREHAFAAMDLRVAGQSWAAIAVQLGYADPSGPRKAVERYLGERGNEATETLREVEGLRFDALVAAHLPLAMDPAGKRSCEHAGVVLRCVELRMRLHGMEAPRRAVLEADPSVPELDMSQLSDEELRAWMALAEKVRLIAPLPG